MLPTATKSAVIEVIPGRLAWSPEQARVDLGVQALPALELCRHGAKEGSKVGQYHVCHYPRSACGCAFGPLGLDSVLRFCRGLEAKLEGRLPEEGPLVMGTPFGDEESRANAAVLLGAYLIIRLNWTVSRLVKCLGRKEADVKFACAWAHNDLAEPQRVLSVRHCWQGLEVARQHSWITPGFVNDEVETEKACTDYSNTLSRYDVAWIIPGLLMVGADPTTVIFDPNPMTCKQLFPAKHELLTDAGSDDIVKDRVMDGVKLGSAEKELETKHSTSSLITDAAEAESECDSCDTVCKEYGAWASEFECSSVDQAEEPHDFVSFLRQSKIGIVVQANFDDEEGLPPSRCGYTDHALETYGICQSSIRVVDKNGGLPTPSDVARMLQACDGFMQGQAGGQDAVMVHCKGGFGRSVILACCLAISRLDIPGATLLGWVRIVRPGAFTVRAQEAFIRTLRGQRDVLRYAKMPCSEESQGISCSIMPCNIQ